MKIKATRGFLRPGILVAHSFETNAPFVAEILCARHDDEFFTTSPTSRNGDRCSHIPNERASWFVSYDHDGDIIGPDLVRYEKKSELTALLALVVDKFKEVKREQAATKKQDHKKLNAVSAWQQLERHAKVDSTEIDENYFTVSTKPLAIKAIPIGRMMIRLDPRRVYRIFIANKDFSFGGSNRAHPHVNVEGLPCWGRDADLIKATIKTGSVYYLVDAIIHWLEHSYNSESSYSRIETIHPNGHA